MTKTERKRIARQIVRQMLQGRCCPETEDVREYTDDEGEQEKLIADINAILDRLWRQLSP